MIDTSLMVPDLFTLSLVLNPSYDLSSLTHEETYRFRVNILDTVTNENVASFRL